MADSSTDRKERSSEIRKRNKPFMEKKRRERINACLEQLKSFLMESTKQEGSHHSKLEKADILEMTVKYLKGLHRQQVTGRTTNDSAVVGKYVAGFNECAGEATRYLSQVEGFNTDLRGRLVDHLTSCLTQTKSATQNPSPLQTASNQHDDKRASSPALLVEQSSLGAQTVTTLPMQLVPGKLPTGELVFFLTNPVTNALLPYGTQLKHFTFGQTQSPSVALNLSTEACKANGEPVFASRTSCTNECGFINILPKNDTEHASSLRAPEINLVKRESLAVDFAKDTGASMRNVPLCFLPKDKLFDVVNNNNLDDTGNVWRPW